VVEDEELVLLLMMMMREAECALQIWFCLYFGAQARQGKGKARPKL
jgi:hypothetical protein